MNGDKDKGRKPIKPFINEINQYPGLVDIMLAIEGLINKRSSHASGVIMFDEDPYEFGSFMKTPNGEVITAYDLHDDEAVGLVKYDFLVTEVQDKIAQAIKFLQDNKEIENNLTLREVYNSTLDLRRDPRFLDCDIQDNECHNPLPIIQLQSLYH